MRISRTSSDRSSRASPSAAISVAAITFALGAALPLLALLLAPAGNLELTVAAASVLFLGLLGYLGAQAGRANVWKSVARVVFWGVIAMLVTAGIGLVFGAVV